MDTILPTGYFHLVATVPHDLNPLFLINPVTMYSLLMRTAAQSVIQLARTWKRLKAKVGLTAVLHTWNQDLALHPHVHMVVTAGGLDESETRWISAPDNFLLPVKALSNRFRSLFTHELQKAFDAGQLVLHPTSQPFGTRSDFTRFMHRIRSKKWVVFAKQPFAGPETVFAYLSRYTHRVAISNQRLLSMTETQVTFSARDNSTPGASRTVSLTPEEFIRRFLLHVLPAGFTKIRYYGLMASCHAKTKLLRARELLERAGVSPTAEASRPPADATWQELYRHLTGIDLMLCPRCGKGNLIRQPLHTLIPFRSI